MRGEANACDVKGRSRLVAVALACSRVECADDVHLSPSSLQVASPLEGMEWSKIAIFRDPMID